MKYPPILQILFAAGLAWALGQYTPVYQLSGIVVQLAACICAIAGAVFLGGAVMHFRRNKTTINPLDPSKAQHLVVGGFYRITRNPMYVGLAWMLVAWCLFLSELSTLVSVPLFIFGMTELQIKPEERALTKKFGEDYRVYFTRVRRWL